MHSIVKHVPLRTVVILACIATHALGAATPESTPFPLTEAQKERLNRALAPLHETYDPEARMLRSALSSPGYHTTLTSGLVHSTRSSLEYAVALLDTGDPQLLGRACDILRTVIALQDQDPKSRTYGIWSWFLEEPLGRMAPPDWNWADFCGVQLLQVALDHRPRLPEELARAVDEAIRHAARSIQRRNVGPGYTNIAIMGTYVTFVASELYGWSDLKDYAAARLRRFHEYTMDQGSFTEYNSPTYSMVAIAELGRMRLHVRDAAARSMIEELYTMAWDDVARHFHAPTRQWAGPHSRCYSRFLGHHTLTTIQRATGGRVDFGVDVPGIAEQRLPLPCPAGLIPFFERLDAPREIVKSYQKGDPPVIGTTWLEPAFAIGSVSRGDLWNQRNALVAYWGEPGRASYLRVRFLRDDYDFAAAQFFSAQRRGDVLAAVNFATDGGNTHVSIDRLTNGAFRARDLRLRFELGGPAAAQQPVAPATPADPARMRFDGLAIDIAVPFCRFGDARPAWETGRNRETAWIDVVLHQGPEREFHLKEIETAAIGLAVRIATGDTAAPIVEHAVADGRLQLIWDALALNIPMRPDTVGAQQRGVRFGR